MCVMHRAMSAHVPCSTSKGEAAVLDTVRAYLVPWVVGCRVCSEVGHLVQCLEWTVELCAPSSLSIHLIMH